MSHFGNALRVVLEKRGITQRAFARLCDIDPTNLGRHMRGITRPDIETLSRFCRCLLPTEGTEIVIAHLHDEIPANVKQFIRISNLLDSTVKESGAEYYSASLPEQLESDLREYRRLAIERQEVADALRSTIRLIIGK